MLQGIELINCAKANARQGIAVAAQQSGFKLIPRRWHDSRFPPIPPFERKRGQSLRHLPLSPSYRKGNDIVSPPLFISSTGETSVVSPLIRE